jgi:TatD DNase family protein
MAADQQVEKKEPEKSNAVYIDSHCHIDMDAFDADRDAVVARARAAGLQNMLVVGCVDAANGHRRALATAEALGLPASAGVHPHDSKLATEAIHAELTDWARAKRIVAIGEIGLDYHYDHSPRETQRAVFRRQIGIAREVGLPIIIHTREAEDDTAAILEDERVQELGGIIHCFTGTPPLAERALALGFYISFSGIVTFPRATNVHEVARTVPLDRLLIETDAPLLAPIPHRGKRNEPAHVVEVARKVAALRGTTPEAIGQAALDNFNRLFRL